MTLLGKLMFKILATYITYDIGCPLPQNLYCLPIFTTKLQLMVTKQGFALIV